jgi:hypothetical protein
MYKTSNTALHSNKDSTKAVDTRHRCPTSTTDTARSSHLVQVTGSQPELHCKGPSTLTALHRSLNLPRCPSTCHTSQPFSSSPAMITCQDLNSQRSKVASESNLSKDA